MFNLITRNKKPKTRDDYRKIKRQLESDPDHGQLFTYMTLDHFINLVSKYFDTSPKKLYN
jgi:hypothetical protein